MTECFDSVGDKSTTVFWLVLLQLALLMPQTSLTS